MRVRVVAHITARPETIPAVREVLLGFIEPTREEVGCIFYELLQDNTDPCQFTFVKEWASDEALDIHLRTPHLTAGVSRLSTLIAERLDVRRCTLIACSIPPRTGAIGASRPISEDGTSVQSHGQARQPDPLRACARIDAPDGHGAQWRT